MITGFLITAFYVLIYNLVAIFPTGDLGIPSGFTDGLTLIVSYLHNFSWLLPVDDLLAALVFVVGVWATLLVVKVVLWIIRTIRGSGS